MKSSDQALDGLQIFSTCPQSKDIPRDEYLGAVGDAARWSEQCGCSGILVYTDNGLVDPWLVSQVILQETERLAPLVAIQPIYMHPYTAAKMIASLAYLHRRKIFLNMLAGGFKNDLIALGDETPHDDRYVRTTEYTQIIRKLLEGSAPASFQGKYYQVDKLKMTPPIPPELFPGILISGSSDAGMAAAEAIEATAVRYPRPPGEEDEVLHTTKVPCGVRVGVIARDDGEEAWRVAHERFPEDRKGQVTHQLAMKTSDSKWHEQLSKMGEKPVSEENPYWLGPFQNYRTFCPYLVGSYDRTADEVARYIKSGYRTFILDIPPSLEELEHTSQVFSRAVERAGQ